MGPTLKILVIEHHSDDARRVLRALRDVGLRCTAQRADTPGEIAFHLEYFQPHIVLSEASLPSMDGLDALRLVRRHAPDTPFIFVTKPVEMDWVDEALREGAVDVVAKTRLNRLVFAVNRVRTIIHVQLVRGQISETGVCRQVRNRAPDTGAMADNVIPWDSRKRTGGPGSPRRRRLEKTGPFGR